MESENVCRIVASISVIRNRAKKLVFDVKMVDSSCKPNQMCFMLEDLSIGEPGGGVYLTMG